MPDSLVVSLLDLQLRGRGFELLGLLVPLSSPDIMGTLNICCQWEDQALRERADHMLSYLKVQINYVADTSCP